MTDRELFEITLDALEEINKLSVGENAICLPAEIDTAMDALRGRVEQLKPLRPWVGLTDEEINAIPDGEYMDFYKAIEAKLKEKNTI